MTAPTPCMGGWCAKRDRCPNYHAENRTEPAERLCIPGQDGVVDVVVLISRATGEEMKEAA